MVTQRQLREQKRRAEDRATREIKLKRKSKVLRIAKVFVAISLFYTVIYVGGIYMDYKYLKQEVKQQVRYAVVNEEDQIHNTLMSKLEAKNINIQAEQVVVQKSDDFVSIKANFEETFRYFGVPVYKFHFEVNESKSLLG